MSLPYARISRLVRGPAIYAFAGRGVQYAAQLAFVLFVPKLLLPEYFVQFSLLVPIATLGASLVFGWFTNAAYRHAHRIVDTGEGGDRQTAYFFYGAVSLGLIVIYGLAVLLSTSIYPVILLLLAASGLKTGLLSVLNSVERHRSFLFANLGFAASLVVFLALCGFLPNEKLPLILAVHGGLDITVAVTGWYLIGVFTVRPLPRFDSDVGARYWHYGMPLVPKILAAWIISLSDRYMLALWEPTEQVAGYILSYQLGGSMVTIPMAFAMAVLYPRILRIDREQGGEVALKYTYRLLRHYVRLIPLMFVLGCAVVIPFMSFFYKAYETNIAVVALIVLAHVILGLTHFLSKEFELNGRTIVISKSVGVAAIVNIALNLMLIPVLGILGAAVATLVAYAASIALIYKARTYVPPRNS